MGLDVAEIVMTVENEFQIQIHDEALSHVHTVGDMSAYVAQAVGDSTSRECPSLRVFLTLRRAMLQVLDVTRSDLRPSTPLTSIPRNLRAKLWVCVADRTGYALPALGLPWTITLLDVAIRLLVILGVLPLIVLAVVELPLIIAMLAGTVGITLLFVVAVSDYDLWRRWSLATEFPGNCHNIGDLVRRVTRLEAIREFRASNQPDSVDIYLRVKRIVSEHLNVPAENITPQSRFIEDLRAD